MVILPIQIKNNLTNLAQPGYPSGLEPIAILQLFVDTGLSQATSSIPVYFFIAIKSKRVAPRQPMMKKTTEKK